SRSFCTLCFHAAPPHYIYTLSLHDALPIFNHFLERLDVAAAAVIERDVKDPPGVPGGVDHCLAFDGVAGDGLLAEHVQASRKRRSEEHTSELQSRVEIVCRLLLEKNKELTK